MSELDRDYLRVTALLKLPMTPEQRMACAYLWSRGRRFCVDYGLDNAQWIAFVTAAECGDVIAH